MLKFLASPLVRLSFGLVMLSVAILLMADLLGLVPDMRKAELNSRKVISESLAVQLSSGNLDDQLETVDKLLHSVVERNDNVLSAAVRRKEDNTVVSKGDHSKWTLKFGDRSSPTQVQVPLYNGRQLWGTVEIRFTSLSGAKSIFSLDGSFGMVILVMSLAGFVAYLFFLKRALRELNPDAVIPERVRTALDTLSEGLLIVDENGTIVFSNQSFARKTGMQTTELTGKPAGDLDWEYDAAENPEDLPWLEVLAGRSLPSEVFIRLRTSFDAVYKFTVNASPISGAGDQIRGALITFDDITELESRNEHLSRTLAKLEQSQREITRQNQELHVLATRDPLTGSLNRRAFFQGFEALFAEARDSGETLSCIMVDIDHFKSVNDTYGHALGDVVIKFLAKLMNENSRPTDLVGRLGGEEFCAVLPEADSGKAKAIAERMRLAMIAGDGTEFGVGLKLTSSFGVVEINSHAADHAALMEQSDEALYVAKETGRNRVIIWSPDMEEKYAQERADQKAKMAGKPVPGREQPMPAEEETAAPPVAAAEATAPAPVAAITPRAAPPVPTPVASGGGSVSNRVVLLDRIQQAIYRGRRLDSQVAVMALDIDALRQVKEMLGTSAEDKFSREAVARLKRILRTTDTIAIADDEETDYTVSRMSSDEILLIIPDLPDSELTTLVIQRLFSMQNQPIEVEGHEFFAVPKIGISMFPNDGEDPDNLITKAISAMREARESPGRNRFRFFSDEINQRSKKRIRLEAELHRAVEREEFVVYYQPKANLQTGSIQSMEALVRWIHPEMGMVPPDNFIPIAEQTGLIEEISKLVLHSVCGQVWQWRQSGYADVQVAVNLSPAEFRTPDLAEQILKAIADAKLPTSAIEVEVTESLVLHNMDDAARILQSLSDAGVSIAMDDFGTGYSSMSYLKQFPLSKLKIDRSFIMDITKGAMDASLVSAMIALGHSMGLKVVAEGVETLEELRFLQDLRCNEAQGYYLSKPLPREAMTELLANAEDIQNTILEHAMNHRDDMQGDLSPFTGTLGVLSELPLAAGGRDPKK